MLRLMMLDLVQLGRADGGLFGEKLTELVKGNDLLILHEALLLGVFALLNLLRRLISAGANLLQAVAYSFVEQAALEARTRRPEVLVAERLLSGLNRPRDSVLPWAWLRLGSLGQRSELLLQVGFDIDGFRIWHLHEVLKVERFLRRAFF
eukprot:CAMPEP_0170474722 /NCGR_PEP_ID=MMETSP0123-20130129/16457_1 /TAXON_ID=182087 /ORGANISM="Favella ehrenbergii, Strain Fehren 1" /LENGTH=149 /DNA_ID=CAMNT_0010744685 /DNA_START=716 /DNA_END=1165 /DNA_ORIENTATION=-